MKLTCCCGASIEITQMVAKDATMALNVFKENHAPCLEAWRNSVSLYWCPTIGEMVTSKHIPDAPIMSYKPVTDPYQRFRDAVKEGKRVFVIYGDSKERCSESGPYFAVNKADVNSLVIEGVDIPPQPTQEWLDEHGVELTGECRSPQHEDEWVFIKGRSGLPGGIDRGRGNPCPQSFGDRRWIVRKKKDDGLGGMPNYDQFELWWAIHGCHMTRPASACFGDGHKWWLEFGRSAWTAAQEAKK